jgi:5'-nucleotidase (lipoprotein e(P4) family)
VSAKRPSNPTWRPVAVALTAAAVGACAGTAPRNDANLDATLWVQSAVEYEVVARSVYADASVDLRKLLADSSRTAALEQTEEYRSLPPAVVLDVDETVLDNSPYQARLLETGEAYNSDTWSAWVEERAARPIPGAVEFTTEAEGLGVTVFYVTNRRAHLEPATRDNLEAVGFPVRSDVDVVLTRDAERSKSSRRQAVASSYRVLMLVGDDLADFVDVEGLTPEERFNLARKYEDYWGNRWHMLPNPTYGSWDRALYGYDASLTQQQRTKRKFEHLEPRG